MKKNDLKHLNRSDLIEIIYELQKEQQKMIEEKDALIEELNSDKIALQKELSEQRMEINKAGSIAEATVGLSNVFSDAQKTADKYLKEVFYMHTSTQEKCDEIIKQAIKQADSILSSAETECVKMKENTQKEIQSLWEDYQNKVNDVLKSHKELESFLKK